MKGIEPKDTCSCSTDTDAEADADEDEDVAFATADWAVIASGNNILLQAVGVAALTINWSAVGYYVKVT